MSFPLVLLAGKGAGEKRDERLEHPEDYQEGGLGHLYKLAELRYQGRAFGDEVLDRYTRVRESFTGFPVFNPIYIAGPADRYARFFTDNWHGSVVAPIDKDGELHENVGAVSDTLLRQHPHTLVLLAAGDLLPEVSHLEKLVTLMRTHEATADVILPEVRADAMRELGIHKQPYAFQDPDEGEIEYNFGQVYALRPSQVRWDIFCHAAKIHYGKRAKGFMAKVSSLVWTPALLFGSLTRPRNARSLPYLLTKAYSDIRGIQTGDIDIPEAEKAVGKIALIHDARRKDVRRVVVDVNDYTSFAADIDTEKEAVLLKVTVPE